MQKSLLFKTIQYFKFHPGTATLLTINFVMLFLLVFTDGFSTENLITFGGIVPRLVLEDNEYYRIITAMFLHGGTIHFLSNSLVLFFIGGYLERMIGLKRYIAIYMLSGIASSIFVVIFGESNTVTIGASGAIFGVMGALFLLTIKKQIWFTQETIKSVRNLMLINLIFTFIIPFISVPGHIGGLIFGIVLMNFIIPDLPYYLKNVPQFRGDKMIIEEEEENDYDA
jgi:rhomboid protease GluP